MNISTTQAVGGDVAQALQAGSAPSSGTTAASPPAGDDFAGGLPSGAQAAYAGLQTTAAFVQTAAGYLGRAGELLNEMSGLADGAQGGAGAGGDFTRAQEELRGVVSGSEATFGGAPLFGASSVGGIDLGGGAIQSLVAQDASGNFLVGASSPGASAAVAGALLQVTSASDGVGRLQAQVEAALSEAQGESGSAALAIEAPSAAVQASQGAAASIAALGSAAIAAYSGMPTQSALGLLQSA